MKRLHDVESRAERRLSALWFALLGIAFVLIALIGTLSDYDYLTSREAIEDTIRANEYMFTADGKMEN